MIYTSYFSKFKGDFGGKKYTDGVSITLGGHWWKGNKCNELAPTSQILSWWKNLTPEEQKTIAKQNIYKKLYYRDVLSKLNVHEMYKKLDGKVLLCFEKDGDFCHRHIVAEWFNFNNYVCKELDYSGKLNNELPPITSFMNEFSFLDNSYPCQISINKIVYQNAESAIQSFRIINRRQRQIFANLSPEESKVLADSLQQREDWDKIKNDVISGVLKIKFNNPELKEKLLLTGNREITFINDDVKNNLGKILMKIRTDLYK